MQRHSSYTLVALAGDLDLNTFDMVRDSLLALLAETASSRIILDLGDVTFVDARGLSPLVRASNAAAARGGWVRLVNVSDRLQMILEIARLTDTLPTYDTAADAADEAMAPIGRCAAIW